jgi:hypothetical protein
MCIPCYANPDFGVSYNFKVGGFAYATLDFQIDLGGGFAYATLDLGGLDIHFFYE